MTTGMKVVLAGAILIILGSAVYFLVPTPQKTPEVGEVMLEDVEVETLATPMSESTDTTSIETDLEATIVQDEDFSDLNDLE